MLFERGKKWVWGMCWVGIKITVTETTKRSAKSTCVWFGKPAKYYRRSDNNIFTFLDTLARRFPRTCREQQESCWLFSDRFHWPDRCQTARARHRIPLNQFSLVVSARRIVLPARLHCPKIWPTLWHLEALFCNGFSIFNQQMPSILIRSWNDFQY